MSKPRGIAATVVIMWAKVTSNGDRRVLEVDVGGVGLHRGEVKDPLDDACREKGWV